MNIKEMRDYFNSIPTEHDEVEVSVTRGRFSYTISHFDNELEDGIDEGEDIRYLTIVLD